MLQNKIIYLLFLASMILFFILFIDDMSLIILILTIIFPFVQLFFLFSISRNINAVLNTENVTLHRNKESKIIVNIRNKSIFPVSCAVATLKITNTLTGEEQLLTTMMPVSADNEQSIKFSVSYAHCGKINITLKKIKIYDYIKLFSKTIFLNITQEIIVLPSLVKCSPVIETSLMGITENDEFSKIKPGDDCSEVFNIREYSYGDKLNRIHWNLTTKLDNMMVKEYSLPVSSQIIIVFEFCNDNNSEDVFYKNDAAIETAMSLSHFMLIYLTNYAGLMMFIKHFILKRFYLKMTFQLFLDPFLYPVHIMTVLTLLSITKQKILTSSFHIRYIFLLYFLMRYIIIFQY